MPTGLRPGQAGGIALREQRGREYFVQLAQKSVAARAARTKSAIMAKLQIIVAEIAEQARANASWSNEIPDAISVGTVTINDTAIECDLIVDLDKAPHAAAFEYGSGIHGKTARTYPITAKNKPLAFQFGLSGVPRPEKFIKMVGINSDGMLAYLISVKGTVTGLTFWKYVDHPGVDARPYIKPAVDERIEELKDGLGKSFVDAIVKGIFNEAQ